MRYTEYISSQDESLRFLVGTKGDRPLFAIGLNPNTATQYITDNTVAKAENLANMHRHQGLIMLNLYPLRSRTAKDLPNRPDESVRARNEREILNALSRVKSPCIWAAWGNDIRRRDYLQQTAASIIMKIHKIKPVWLHFGALTVKGHPRHPSRVSYSWNFQRFDAESYLPIIEA
jgi:hypothetical protein